MNIAIVVAVALNNAIGKNGHLLWQLPRDMAHFKTITIGHHVLMGRKTWESIPPKFRPLVGRDNLVISKQPDLVCEGATVCKSLEAGIELAQREGETELMVIGGGSIYAATLPFAKVLYLTRVQTSFPDADTFFPEVDEEQWQIESSELVQPDDRNQFGMEFVKLIRL